MSAATKTFELATVTDSELVALRSWCKAYAKSTGNTDGFRCKRMSGSQSGRIQVATQGATVAQKLEILSYLAAQSFELYVPGALARQIESIVASDKSAIVDVCVGRLVQVG